MKKEELMELVGKTVEVKFKREYWARKVKGVLGYTKELSQKYDYRKPGYFTVGDYNFKVSHITSCKVLDLEREIAQGEMKE